MKVTINHHNPARYIIARAHIAGRPCRKADTIIARLPADRRPQYHAYLDTIGGFILHCRNLQNAAARRAFDLEIARQSAEQGGCVPAAPARKAGKYIRYPEAAAWTAARLEAARAEKEARKAAARKKAAEEEGIRKAAARAEYLSTSAAEAARIKAIDLNKNQEEAAARRRAALASTIDEAAAAPRVYAANTPLYNLCMAAAFKCLRGKYKDSGNILFSRLADEGSAEAARQALAREELPAAEAALAAAEAALENTIKAARNCPVYHLLPAAARDGYIKKATAAEAAARKKCRAHLHAVHEAAAGNTLPDIINITQEAYAAALEAGYEDTKEAVEAAVTEAAHVLPRIKAVKARLKLAAAAAAVAGIKVHDYTPWIEARAELAALQRKNIWHVMYRGCNEAIDGSNHRIAVKYKTASAAARVFVSAEILCDIGGACAAADPADTTEAAILSAAQSAAAAAADTDEAAAAAEFWQVAEAAAAAAADGHISANQMMRAARLKAACGTASAAAAVMHCSPAQVQRYIHRLRMAMAAYYPALCD